MKLKKQFKILLIGLTAFAGLFSLMYFTAEDTSAGAYYKVTDFTREDYYEPITLEVQEGDRLTRNGIEIMVFEDVKTGLYTLTTGGYFELYRKN